MKKFISLGAALMMGTVLSKEHKHKKSIAKAETIKNDGFQVAKKDSVESIEEPDIFDVENNDPQIISEATYSNYQSPETSKETVEKNEQSES